MEWYLVLSFLTIGNISIPEIWLAFLLASFLSPFVIRIIERNSIESWYWNVLLIYFISWKFSYILFNFDMFLDMPLSVIYFNGGDRGHILAVITITIYLALIAFKKHQKLSKDAGSVFLLFFITLELVMSLLEKNFFQSYLNLFVFIALLVLIILNKKEQNFSLTPWLILLSMVELLVMSFSHSMITIQPITFIWISSFLIFITFKIRRDKVA